MPGHPLAQTVVVKWSYFWKLYSHYIWFSNYYNHDTQFTFSVEVGSSWLERLSQLLQWNSLMAAYTNTGLGDLREGRHVGVLSEALSCSPKELWLSLHKATLIRTNQNKNVSYYNWTPSPHVFILRLHDTITSKQTPPQCSHTKEWRRGNEALSWLCLLSLTHWGERCSAWHTEVSIAQLDTLRWALLSLIQGHRDPKLNLLLAKSSSPIFLSLSTDFFALLEELLPFKLTFTLSKVTAPQEG